MQHIKVSSGNELCSRSSKNKKDFLISLWKEGKSVKLRTLFKHVSNDEIESVFPGSISRYKNNTRLIQYNTEVRKAYLKKEPVYLIKHRLNMAMFDFDGNLIDYLIEH